MRETLIGCLQFYFTQIGKSGNWGFVHSGGWREHERSVGDSILSWEGAKRKLHLVFFSLWGEVKLRSSN